MFLSKSLEHHARPGMSSFAHSFIQDAIDTTSTIRHVFSTLDDEIKRKPFSSKVCIFLEFICSILCFSSLLLSSSFFFFFFFFTPLAPLSMSLYDVWVFLVFLFMTYLKCNVKNGIESLCVGRVLEEYCFDVSNIDWSQCRCSTCFFVYYRLHSPCCQGSGMGFCFYSTSQWRCFAELQSFWYRRGEVSLESSPVSVLLFFFSSLL